MNPRFWLKLCVSVTVGAVCVVYALAGVDRHEVLQALSALPLSAVGVYLLMLAGAHLLGALRLQYLHRPLGVAGPRGGAVGGSSGGLTADPGPPRRPGAVTATHFVARAHP